MIPGIIAASVAAGWDPGDMTVPPYFWFDDTSVVTSSGAASQWLDRSGNGVNYSQGSSGNRPAVIASAVNGLQCLRFDGADDYLAGGTAARAFARNKGYAWVLSVARRRSGAGLGCLFAVGNETSARVNCGFNYPSEGGFFAASSKTDGGAEAVAATSGVAAIGDWHLLLDEFDFSGNRLATWVDGAIATEVTSAWSSGSNTSNTDPGLDPRIGSYPSGGNFLSSDLAAQVGGHQTFAAGDMDRLFGWAAWRYGLEGNLPVGHPYKDAPP